MDTCNIYRDGARWVMTRGAASASSDEMGSLEGLAKDAGYEVSYRNPNASLVLDHDLCDRLRAAVLKHAQEGYGARPGEVGTTGVAWMVAWLVEYHPDLAQVMLHHLDKP